MTARAAFKQDDVARAVKGVAAGGLSIGRVEVAIAASGEARITIVTGESDAAMAGPANPWDDEFNGDGQT